jgi:predicted HAD superfamily phosphohydrolase YqeG
MTLKRMPSGLELVIFDLNDTLIYWKNGSAFAREGIRALLETLKKGQKKIVVSSDADEEFIESSIRWGRKYFDAIYGARHLFYYDNRPYKNLRYICEDMNVQPKKAIFIGDNFADVDRSSAEMFGIKFIQVPKYEAFSFEQLMPET